MNLRILIFCTLLIGFSANAMAEQQFKVGQKYQNFIQLAKNGSKMQLALPEGEWQVSGTRYFDPASSGSERATIYLINIVDKKVRGLILLRYVPVSYYRAWRASSFCKRTFNNFNEQIAMHDGTQTDCWGVSYFRMTTSGSSSSEGARSTLKFARERGAKIPINIVYARFQKAEYGEYLSVTYAFNPEFYGVSKPENAEFKSSDYTPDRIDDYPDKKAFVDRFISWGKSFKKFVDLGFKSKLTGSETSGVKF